MQLVAPMPFGEAVGKIGVKTPIGSAMASAEWADVPVALRERAFFSSEVESVRFLQRARDAIGDFLAASRETLPTGETVLRTGSRAEFVDQMRAFALGEGMGPFEPGQAGTLKDITSEKRLGLIFDVQTQQANDYGYWRQGMDRMVLNEFPAQRFVRVREVKQERQSHVPFEGQVYLKTDPVWAQVINADFGVPWGPWGWGCGHDVEDVDRAEAERLGLVRPNEVVQPDRKNFNENLKASAAGLDPDLVEKLKRDLGRQIEISGEEIRWVASGAATAPQALPVPQAPVPSARQNPVSGGLELQVGGELKDAVEAALAAIDSVHDDGDLPKIPLTGRRGGSLGTFSYGRDGQAKGIDIQRGGPWAALTSVHEVGHFLDLEAIGKKTTFATLEQEGGMKEVLAAAEQTKAIQGLRAETAAWKGYFLKPQEIWARAYAQFIAERSGDKRLLAELERARAAQNFRQWETKDFEPVASAIEAMFKRLRWL